jgi:hypothetical protein
MRALAMLALLAVPAFAEEPPAIDTGAIVDYWRHKADQFGDEAATALALNAPLRRQVAILQAKVAELTRRAEISCPAAVPNSAPKDK